LTAKIDLPKKNLGFWFLSAAKKAI